MVDNNMIYFAKTGEGLSQKLYLNPRMANRHGFICGATGTGKTVTLKVLAESFSKMGVPVFLSDVKGDLSGMIRAGEDSEGMQKRLDRFDLREDFEYQSFPAVFYDIYGKKGTPLRTTVSEMGPNLLAQCLGLNDTQADVLSVIFKIVDDDQLLLIDTKDLKVALSWVSDNISDYEMEYGHIAKATITTIIRSIVALEAEGGDQFFGEPAIDITDFFNRDLNGRGYINILDSETLINKPRLYTAFMLYLLSELFEVLPEVGDPEKPKMVFFFDEAHLLFNSASPVLMQKIEQVVKLIRSKGVGVYFVTQSPGDIPNAVMAQLSNKIEHALRAYTPQERKALRAAADAFRENPSFDTIELLQQLGVGEAIVSVLDNGGIPMVAEHAYILPPESYMGIITDDEREQAIKASNLNEKYGEMVDPDSAYEVILRRKKQLDDDALAEAARIQDEKDREKAEKEAQKQAEKEAKEAAKQAEKEAKEAEKAAKAAEKEEQKKKDAVSGGVKQVLSSGAGTVGREVGKAVGSTFGGTFGKKIGSNMGAQLGRSILGTLFKLFK